ncbi:MAG: type II toxin-antitoxin system YafQ family toxin [Candidatus Methanoplasma sp.]|jgi:mRNA interferase YafQ|nr:type II toxin-antitoxin system YafQ family toxin [Candidatus Methanoplasma sp.]
MKRELRTTHRFMKDFKRVKKRGYDLDALRAVLKELVEGKRLSPSYMDHPLKGEYNGFRECHITSDWLLIYTIVENGLVLIAFRTGTHSDLFE